MTGLIAAAAQSTLTPPEIGWDAFAPEIALAGTALLLLLLIAAGRRLLLVSLAGGAATIAVGAWRARGAPHVRAYLVILLALMAVLAPDITESWVNTSRSVIAGMPLATWAITARA